MANTLAESAAEAYVSGWALTEAPFTERIRAGCTAAVSVALERPGDPQVLELSLHLGHLEGVWQTVFDRRLTLTDRIARDITAAWRDLVKKQDIRSLLADYRRELVTFESADTDTKPTKKQKAAALAAALLWLRHVLSGPKYADFAAAIVTAMAEAVAEGRTAALAVAASKATAAGFDWDKAYAAMQAAVTRAETEDSAGAVTQAIMRGMAVDLAKVLAQAQANGLSDEDTGDALSTAIDDGEGAELAVDTAVSGYYGMGSIGLAAAEGIMLDWLTAGDGRVCPECQDNEDNGPYEPSAFPSLPDHPRCRCTSAPAEPLRFTAFSDFLVPAA